MDGAPPSGAPAGQQAEHGSRKPHRRGPRGRGRAAASAGPSDAAKPQSKRGGGARGGRRRGGAPAPPQRPAAPRNSSGYIMRSRALGSAAPIFSPPTSTPHGARWGGVGLDETALGVDAFGSNLELIRPVRGGGAAGEASDADEEAAAGGAGRAEETGVEGFVFMGPSGAGGQSYVERLESENEKLRTLLSAAERRLAAIAEGSVAPS